MFVIYIYLHTFMYVHIKLFNYLDYSDSNNQRLMLGDSAMLPVVGGKAGLKSQGTITHSKPWRVDQKK